MESESEGVVPTRMRRQGLWSPTAPDATTVLDSLVAMQGQEFAYALWALAQRIPTERRPTHADMLASFDRGDILRTHVLRTTWHLVLPRDVRPLLRLTTPRLRRQLVFYDRQLSLDRAELDRSQAILAGAVAGGRHRTRRELADALNAAGVEASGQRLGHLMMHAEFDEVLISGEMAGKQQTYAAFDERVPAADGPFDEDAALTDFARRYTATRAPVTAKDFAGWASLTVSRARAGLEAATHERREIDGTVFYSPPGGGPDRPECPRGGPSPRVDLLQGYDEMIMSYSQSRGVILPAGAALPVLNWDNYLHAVLVDGVLAGHWRHQLTAKDAVVQAQPIRPWSASERRAVAAAVDEYGRYLGRPTALE
ncbi:MAG TPA: winged helix DNA-binding domain-containing protein [Nakamurella sp.]